MADVIALARPNTGVDGEPAAKVGDLAIHGLPEQIAAIMPRPALVVAHADVSNIAQADRLQRAVDSKSLSTRILSSAGGQPPPEPICLVPLLSHDGW
jgi:hypothetical protein